MKKLKDMLARVRRESKGFTLVELIVVIAILGILTAIAVPTYSGYVKKANTAADQTLLDSINSAFASACISEGENQLDVHGAIQIKSDGSLNKDADGVVVTVSGDEGYALTDEKKDAIEAAFNVYYGSNADSKFKEAKDTFVFIVDGVADFDMDVDSEALETFRGSTLGSLGGSQLLNLVSSGVGSVPNLGDYSAAVSSTSFMNDASAVLGMDYATYLAEQKEAAARAWCEREGRPYEEPFITLANNATNEDVEKKLNTNLMVAIGAKNAQTASGDILTLLQGTGAKQSIKDDLNNQDKASTAVSQAALAYGLYTSYATLNNKGTGVSDFTGALVDGTDANNGFKAYLATEQATTDLNGLLAAMGMINDQSTDTIKDAVSNGFDDSDLANKLKDILG